LSSGVFINWRLANGLHRAFTGRSSRGHRRAQGAYRKLEAELAKLEAAASVHGADFERERCERLMVEVLKTT
jgi:hypothetical protein